MPAGEHPILSILLPAHNAEKYVAAAIQSILKQTYSNFELLLCDDASTDSTLRILQQFNDGRIRVFNNSVNKGKNKTCEFLLAHTTGKYISIHDADDISRPERFAKQIDFLERHPDYALCGTNFISFLNSNKIIDHSHLEVDTNKIREKIKTVSQFHGPTIVFRKEILPQVGGFYRYFTRAEDIDLTMRIAEKFNTTNLAEYLYLYRHVSSSLTNNLEGYNLERLGHAKLIYYLAEEREKHNGIDSLMRHDTIKIEALMRDFVQEYLDDPDIALRRGVFRLLAMHMYWNAVKLSWKAMSKTPGMLNVKCFIYAVFHAVYGKLKLMFKNESVDLTFLK